MCLVLWNRCMTGRVRWCCGLGGFPLKGSGFSITQHEREEVELQKRIGFFNQWCMWPGRIRNCSGTEENRWSWVLSPSGGQEWNSHSDWCSLWTSRVKTQTSLWNGAVWTGQRKDKVFVEKQRQFPQRSMTTGGKDRAEMFQRDWRTGWQNQTSQMSPNEEMEVDFYFVTLGRCMQNITNRVDVFSNPRAASQSRHQRGSHTFNSGVQHWGCKFITSSDGAQTLDTQHPDRRGTT